MKSIIVPVCFMLGIATGIAAEAGTYVCPEKIKIESGTVVLAAVPAGYVPKVQPQVLWFSGAGVSDGPPEELWELKPYDADDRRKRASRSTWKELDSSTRAVWLGCYYGEQTVSVSVQAEGRPSECVAIYQGSAAKRSLRARFECH